MKFTVPSMGSQYHVSSDAASPPWQSSRPSASGPLRTLRELAMASTLPVALAILPGERTSLLGRRYVMTPEEAIGLAKTAGGVLPAQVVELSCVHEGESSPREGATR